MARLLWLVAVAAGGGAWLAGGCDEPAGPDGDSDVDSDVDGDGDVDSDVDSDADGDADSDEPPPCDLVRNEGCGEGEKCGVRSMDGEVFTVACVPLPADAAGPGEACEWLPDVHFGVYDDCAGGSVCLSREGASGDTCERLCSLTDASTCRAAYPGGRDGLCLSRLEGMPVVGLMACLATDGCSARCQDCAGRGAGCYAASDGANAGTLCLAFDRGDLGGDGTTGDTCHFVDECAPGYHCLSGSCRPYCALPAEADGDADADADADGGDGGADADADEPPPCPFDRCEDHPGAGLCAAPPESEPPFGPSTGLGLCLE